jgi:RHS repeat-associated protein
MLSVTDANGTDISETETHIANINPFRYRSYYYDAETGLYYLQSRYYDPEVGRFINGDNEQSLLSEGLGCIGYNIFTYCQNNPINGSDIDGCAFIQVVAKIILGIILGIYIQLVFDILDYLLNLLSDPNATFSASGKDYILSILSSILSFFSFKKCWVRISIGALQIIFSYLGDSLTKQVWANIITDVMFLFVSEIVGGAIDRKNAKKIEKATKTINKNKKKLSKTLKIAKLNKKKLIIEEKFYALGVGITFSLNISNKLINSVANFFIK